MRVGGAFDLGTNYVSLSVDHRRLLGLCSVSFLIVAEYCDFFLDFANSSLAKVGKCPLTQSSTSTPKYPSICPHTFPATSPPPSTSPQTPFPAPPPHLFRLSFPTPFVDLQILVGTNRFRGTAKKARGAISRSVGISGRNLIGRRPPGLMDGGFGVRWALWVLF